MKAGHFRDVHGNEIAATFATEKTRWEDEAEQAAATLVTEKARWEDEAEQAGAVKQPQADADERLKEARADGYLQGLRDRLSHSSLPETPRRSGRKLSFFQGR